MSSVDASSGGESWQLLPLTPEYLPDEHSGYVREIEAKLRNPKIRNIALSGNYGVGKSSILAKVTELQGARVVVLSLSTLTPVEVSDLEDAVPKQATTPTNRIQQEIVKQLLYREKPSKAPGSRFRRIEHFAWGREVAIAALLGTVTMVISLLTGWTGQITTELAPLVDLGLWIHPLLLILAGGGVLCTRHLLHGRMRIKQLAAGSATVTLDDSSVSYFDQYLDEIVYFFEVSKIEIVIFEDIDRFNNSHIFETLRALNILLNAVPRIKKPIRFIYAIKDSIFDKLGLEQEHREIDPDILAVEDPARAETMRANRTKFFDLVIPVVPFITHRSARNLATQLLDKIEHDVSPELIDLATRHVPDMRLLKNVRNEFIVFRDRIFSGEGKSLQLSETDLFAMMLYKSTHLTDFEKIRIGTSALDELYEASRHLVQQNVTRLQEEVRLARGRLTSLDKMAQRSASLGDRLLAHIERTARAAGTSPGNGRYALNRAAKTCDDLRSSEFWIELAEAAEEPTLQWSNGSRTLRFTRSDIAAALGIKLNTDDWRKADHEEIQEELDQHLEDLAYLRKADLGELVKRPDFTVNRNGGDESLDKIAHDLLTPGLAYQLIRAGYLNRNFTLYTSTFHGDRVTAAATNFIIHHVERGVMDEHFHLNTDDVEAVIRECGKNALAEPALYNIAVLDHLLRTDEDSADIMIRSFVSLGEDQARFIQQYLSSGTEQDRFVARFAPLSSRVLLLLIDQVDLDEEARLRFVSVALAHLDSDGVQRVDDPVPGYLADHYAEFEVLRSDALTAPQAKRIAKCYSRMHILLPDLESLSVTARQAFVAQDLYAINKDNLQCALGGPVSLALDSIRSNKVIYTYVLANLGTYLAIDRVPHTIENNNGFAAVIEEVLVHDSDRLDDVVARASEACSIADITTVSDNAWPTLAGEARFPATFNNVTRYIEVFGELDANLAKALEASGTITEHDSADEDAKTELATTILVASRQLPARLRAQLAASLKLEHYLDATQVTAEPGELFSLLVKLDVILGDGETYTHLADTDWETRESVIEASCKHPVHKDAFKKDMSVELVQGDLASLLASDKICEAVKTVLVEHADEYFTSASQRALRELARYAATNDHSVSLELVERMALNGSRSEYIVILLEPHLRSLDGSRLFAILDALGDDYARLTSVGWDKPKIPNTAADRSLLECLKEQGIVSSYNKQGPLIKVSKKHK